MSLDPIDWRKWTKRLAGQSRRRSRRLDLERLEDRVVPAGSLLSSNLFQLDGDAKVSLPAVSTAAHDFDQVFDAATYGTSGGQSPVFLVDGLSANNGGSAGQPA